MTVRSSWTPSRTTVTLAAPSGWVRSADTGTTGPVTGGTTLTFESREVEASAGRESQSAPHTAPPSGAVRGMRISPWSSAVDSPATASHSCSPWGTVTAVPAGIMAACSWLTSMANVGSSPGRATMVSPPASAPPTAVAFASTLSAAGSDSSTTSWPSSTVSAAG